VGAVLNNSSVVVAASNSPLKGREGQNARSAPHRNGRAVKDVFKILRRVSMAVLYTLPAGEVKTRFQETA
jgi:hypothetical protein